MDRLSYRKRYALCCEAVEAADRSDRGHLDRRLLRLGLRGDRARSDEPNPEHYQRAQGDRIGDQRGPDDREPGQADREPGAEYAFLRGCLGPRSPPKPRAPRADHRAGAGHCLRDGRHGPRVPGEVSRLPADH